MSFDKKLFIQFRDDIYSYDVLVHSEFSDSPHKISHLSAWLTNIKEIEKTSKGWKVCYNGIVSAYWITLPPEVLFKRKLYENL